MSSFAHRNAKDSTGGEQSMLPCRRKETGQLLAVDILRGRQTDQYEYSVGCLSDETPLCQLPCTQGDLAAVNGAEVTSQNMRRTPRHSTDPSVLSNPEDIFESHSYQQRPMNMGWNGVVSESRGYQSRTVYANPFNCLPSTGTSPTEEAKDTLKANQLSVQIDKRGSTNSVVEKVSNSTVKSEQKKKPYEAPAFRLKHPARTYRLADVSTLHPAGAHANKHMSMKSLRQHSPWKSFVQESTVPDVPVSDFTDTGTKKMTAQSTVKTGSLIRTSASPKQPVSAEKSVSWKDDKPQARTDCQSTKCGSVDLQASQMDELVTVLAKLCDALENSPMLTPQGKRDTLPDTGLISGPPTATKPGDGRGRSADACHETKQLAHRTEKVIVEVRVVFLKIGEIDTLKEFYQADAFLQTKWREPRLDGRSPEELGSVDLDRYWNPLCYIDNILSETKEVQWISTVTGPNSEVYIVERRRIKGVFLETLELNDFPLDVQ
uniref:Neur_chan_LBD domain-containing protein n=1 Tax=Mesocestoides corti TaxID=53468 RepID=A0A5K3FN35_MESCO